MNKCIQCGTDTNNNKFCGHSCRATHINKKRKKQSTICLNCSNAIIAYNSSKRKFCNSKCCGEYKTKQQQEKIKDDLSKGINITEGSFVTLRRVLLNQSDNKCSICGQRDEWNDKPLSLHIDHIDGNCMNNIQSNLRVLCPHCHSQTDTYGNKNTRNKNSSRAKKC